MQEDEAPPELRPFSLFSALCYRDPPGMSPQHPVGAGLWPVRWFPEGVHITRRVSPFGATSFALGGKGGKTPPGVSRGRLTAPAGPPPDPRLRGLSLRPSTEVPARKIRFRVLIPPGPLGPVAVQNFGFFQFPAAPGSGQPWQGMRDRVCAGWSRSHKRGRASLGLAPTAF